MRLIRIVTGLGLAVLLLAPAAALAQSYPERLDGFFLFEDQDQQGNNTLDFQIEGREVGVEGQVQASASVDGTGFLVTIIYDSEYPSQFTGDAQNASIRQDREVLVTLRVSEEGVVEPVYEGQAVPTKCKVQAKLHDAQSNDPDDPEKAQATLTCGLGNDFDELGPGAPSSDVLAVVETAFEPRKDVKVDTSNGKLQIKHVGEPLLE
jgi:hypothetical protein